LLRINVAFGEDIVPASYEDFEHTDMVVLVGSNTAWCHPVLYQRIMQAKSQNPDLFVVVVDPRFTSTCEQADLHLPFYLVKMSRCLMVYFSIYIKIIM
jgi:assimilatory nitrate reductase catalytic subunit